MNEANACPQKTPIRGCKTTTKYPCLSDNNLLINHCHVLDLNPMFTSYQLASPRLASRYNFQSFAQIISLGNGQWALSK